MQLISCVAHGKGCHKSLPRVARSVRIVQFLCRVNLHSLQCYYITVFFWLWFNYVSTYMEWDRPSVQINTRKWIELCIAWIALSVDIWCTVAFTLKSSPMTRVNDVIYFHSIVWMWFVMWTVPEQIPVTSAAYSMCREANPSSTAQRGVLDGSTDPGGDWTSSLLL